MSVRSPDPCKEGTLLLHQGISLWQLCYTGLVGGLPCSALDLTVGLVCLALHVVPGTLGFTCSAYRLR